MQAAGIKINKYIAYEVDKYAIKTAQHNFPFIEERGDVFKADFKEYAGSDRAGVVRMAGEQIAGV